MDVPGWTFHKITHSQFNNIATSHDYHTRCNHGDAWFGFGNSGIIGSISTALNGCGHGILDYGNCLDGNSTVLLNGKEISWTTSKSKVVEFDFYDGDVIKLVEKSGILIFHKFYVTNCGLKCKC